MHVCLSSAYHRLNYQNTKPTSTPSYPCCLASCIYVCLLCIDAEKGGGGEMYDRSLGQFKISGPMMMIAFIITLGEIM